MSVESLVNFHGPQNISGACSILLKLQRMFKTKEKIRFLTVKLQKCFMEYET